MNIEQLNQANDLILRLTNYVVQQKKELEAIWKALEAYQDFMTQEIKRLQDES